MQSYQTSREMSDFEKRMLQVVSLLADVLKKANGETAIDDEEEVRVRSNKRQRTSPMQFDITQTILDGLHAIVASGQDGSAYDARASMSVRTQAKNDGDDVHADTAQTKNPYIEPLRVLVRCKQLRPEARRCANEKNVKLAVNEQLPIDFEHRLTQIHGGRPHTNPNKIEKARQRAQWWAEALRAVCDGVKAVTQSEHDGLCGVRKQGHLPGWAFDAGQERRFLAPAPAPPTVATTPPASAAATEPTSTFSASEPPVIDRLPPPPPLPTPMPPSPPTFLAATAPPAKHTPKPAPVRPIKKRQRLVQGGAPSKEAGASSGSAKGARPGIVEEI